MTRRKDMILLKLKKYLWFLSLLLVIAYIVLFINIFSLLHEVRAVFLGTVPSSETAGKPIAQYNRYGEYIEQGGIARTKLFFFPYFTLHNFKNGYIWIIYSVEGYDSNGDLLYGTWLSSAKWRIQKNENKWEIIDITEAP